jgi:hypothetical protein
MNNEHMKEAREGHAVLEDVEDDIFVGFCEFAYTGDYRSRMMERRPEIENNIEVGYETSVERDKDVVPALLEALKLEMADEPLMADEPIPTPATCPIVATYPTPATYLTPATYPTLATYLPATYPIPATYWDSGSQKRAKKTKGRVPITKTEQLWSDFKSLKFKNKHPHISDKQLTAANRDLSSASPTTESLLYHAKIYIFAEKYLIDNLRILSLRKLHASLQDFDLTLETSENILELLEFAYTHTARQESSENELRALIVHYAACKIKILKQNVNLRSLLEANGEMGCDLFYMI